MKLFIPLFALLMVTACTPAPPGVAERLAGYAAELIDAQPAAPVVLIPGNPDTVREFAAALALARFTPIDRYLPQLKVSDADTTALAGELAALSTEYKNRLFPEALPPRKSFDCAGLIAAVLRGDLAAATAARGDSGGCPEFPEPVRLRARSEAQALAEQVRREWGSPNPTQIGALWDRIAWSPATDIRPLSTALAGYLRDLAAVSAPFPPNIGPQEFDQLARLIRLGDPAWRPDPAYLDRLRITLDWHGRLPQQVRNDPTSYVYAAELLSHSTEARMREAVPRLRAEVLRGAGQDPLDTGIRAIAARRSEVITDQLLTAAAQAANGDPRLVARVAAMVAYSGRCPAVAGRLVDDANSTFMSAQNPPLTSVYYGAVAGVAASRCAGQAHGAAARERLGVEAARRLPDLLAKLHREPGWQVWFELWLTAEARCASGNTPELGADLPGLAGRTLDASGRETFDPGTAYATLRVLDIAGHGCAGAWFTPPV
ncbi:hypothetical protein D5S17_13090 [Pseudonocardiaceae bacterium YIM PH 21723]|nr:hypothetical protein D5S17_13090 [Pseudonocardiaceae bacterium YIM PH 21723]